MPEVSLAAVLEGAIFRCEGCKRETPLRQHAVAHYLHHGWPKCFCNGHTMRLITRNEADHPANAESPDAQ